MKPITISSLKKSFNKMLKMADDRPALRMGIVVVIVLFVGGIGYGVYSGVHHDSNDSDVVLHSSAELRGDDTNPVFSEGSKKAVDLEERTEDANHNPSDGLTGSISIGTEDTGISVGESVYKKHVENLRTMRNYTFINIIDLTRESPERAKVLAEYDSNLRSFLQQSKDGLFALETEIALLTSDQKYYAELAKSEEAAFKEYLANYDGEEAHNHLESFVDAQKVAGELYTRAKAMQLLAKVYVPLSQLIDTKIRFIAANKQALLKGVSVVDIRGLEETLIQSEKDWLNSLGN